MLVGEAYVDVVESKVQMPLPKGIMGLLFRLMRPIIRVKHSYRKTDYPAQVLNQQS